MKNNAVSIMLPLVAAFSLLGLSACGGGSDYISITGYAQGGTYLVTLNMHGEAGKVKKSREELKFGIDSVLLCIDKSISGYNKGSLLSRFNAGESVVPDSIFSVIYEKSYGYFSMTRGAVDVAAGPLFDIWGFGFTSDSLPSADKVAETLAASGMSRLRPSMEPDSEGKVSGRSLLADPLDAGALPVLNYNAVAQGYSCDLVASYLSSEGVEDMLVDIGGEIYCRGLNPSGQPWAIGVDRPVDGNDTPGEDLQGVMLAGPEPCGVVTSGNYRKFYVRDGRKYAHTIDPRTGYPVSHSLLSATVVAADAALSDALATCCMVIGLEEAKSFIESRPDLEAYLVYDEDGVIKTWQSSGIRIR